MASARSLGFPSLGRKWIAAIRLDRGLTLRLLILVLHGLRDVLRYTVRYVLLLLALYGLINFWDVYGDGQMPMLLPLRHADPDVPSSVSCASPKVSDAGAGRGCRPRWRYSRKSIRRWRHGSAMNTPRERWFFSDRLCGVQGDRGAVAQYDQLQGGLTIYRLLFAENDGTVATVLCHEYRHSRQNWAKVLRHALSFVVAKEGDPSIVENDAELYEHEAHVAIFGR